MDARSWPDGRTPVLLTSHAPDLLAADAAAGLFDVVDKAGVVHSKQIEVSIELQQIYVVKSGLTEQDEVIGYERALSLERSGRAQEAHDADPSTAIEAMPNEDMITLICSGVNPRTFSRYSGVKIVLLCRASQRGR